MLENALVKKIKKALQEKWPEDKWMKIHGGPMQEAGISDLIGCHKGVFIAIEVKRPFQDFKPPTPLQQKFLKDIEKAGGISGCVTTVNGAINLVESIVFKKK